VPIKLEVVTVERVAFNGDVDIITVPGIDGELGILPHHTPLMTILMPGELIARKDGDEYILAISGGFLEIRPDRVIVLADAAERAEEIDIERAEAAKKRAEERLSHPGSQVDIARAQAALQRAVARIEVATRRKRRRQNQ
jgi:F-type H+-transporting ATPase subunit epsilon